MNKHTLVPCVLMTVAALCFSGCAVQSQGNKNLKAEHRMGRCWLIGSTGNALHAVLCAAGYNLRWLMRAVARLGLVGLFALCALFAHLAKFRLRLVVG